MNFIVTPSIKILVAFKFKIKELKAHLKFHFKIKFPYYFFSSHLGNKKNDTAALVDLAYDQYFFFTPSQIHSIGHFDKVLLQESWKFIGWPFFLYVYSFWFLLEFLVIVKTCRKLQWAYFIYSGAFFISIFSPWKYVNGYNWIIGVYFFWRSLWYIFKTWKSCQHKKRCYIFILFYILEPNKLSFFFFCWN